MSSDDYKTDGESLIRYLVARARIRLNKAKEEGKKYDEPVISIPLLKANDIGLRAKARKDRLETLTQILGEISFRIEDEHTIEVKKIKALVDKALIVTTQIK